MARFRYEAVDREGRERNGVADAASERAVRDDLRRRDLVPLAVDEVRADEARERSFVRLPLESLALATRQLATLVGAGTSIDRALVAAGEQADRDDVRRVLAALHADVTAGLALPVALARFPRTFDELYVGLVSAGSETGELGAVLARLADHLEARRALRAKVGVALVYPALVTAIAVIVVSALLFYVVPQVIAVYQQSRQTLPWLTRALIATSTFVRDSGGFVVIALTVVVALTLLLRRRSTAFRRSTDRWLMHTPVIGRLLSELDTARFAGTLAILARSRAPLLASIDAAGRVMRLLPLREAAGLAAERVRAGVPLARALGEARVFPPVVMHLVASGEESGLLPEMLSRAGREMETSVERRLGWVTGLLEPALVVLMGVIVLVLVLAVMLPIVSMNQLIR